LINIVNLKHYVLVKFLLKLKLVYVNSVWLHYCQTPSRCSIPCTHTKGKRPWFRHGYRRVKKNFM